jgi:hypothetical protein
MRITIGADPELFLVNQDGKFISSIGRIGGSKHAPKDIGQGCAIQEDNVAVEFNIAPAESVDAFVKSIDYTLDHLEKVVRQQGLSLSVTASKVFDADQLVHIRAKVFGCEPDYNAWTLKENTSPRAKNKALRSAGGHVHFGVDKKLVPTVQLIRWADVRLGLNSVLEDEDSERRELYGKAGAFRDKPYGAEYRTLSNYWLKNKAFMYMVFERARMAVEDVLKGKTLTEEDGKLIQAAINTGDRKMAVELMKAYV